MGSLCERTIKSLLRTDCFISFIFMLNVSVASIVFGSDMLSLDLFQRLLNTILAIKFHFVCSHLSSHSWNIQSQISKIRKFLQLLWLIVFHGKRIIMWFIMIESLSKFNRYAKKLVRLLAGILLCTLRLAIYY